MNPAPCSLPSFAARLRVVPTAHPAAPAAPVRAAPPIRHAPITVSSRALIETLIGQQTAQRLVDQTALQAIALRQVVHRLHRLRPALNRIEEAVEREFAGMSAPDGRDQLRGVQSRVRGLHTQITEALEQHQALARPGALKDLTSLADHAVRELALVSVRTGAR